MNRKDLEVICQITKTINSILDYPNLLQKVMDLAIEAVGAERGAIILVQEKDELKLAVARHMSKKNLTLLTTLSSSVLWKVIKGRKPLIVHDVADDLQLKEAKSVITQNIKSVLCVPLMSRGEILGAIYVDSSSGKGIFTDENLEFLAAFSDQAAIAIQNAHLLKLIEDENRSLREELEHDYQFSNITGKSPKMIEVFELMKKLLGTDVPVLICGETGTGKELVARALHYNGLRKNGKFVPLYCGSLPETLLESELFGYKKGAFTGASRDKKGLFEEANNGTLFLDEIADISLATQAKLLRVLQEKEFYRIGDTTPRKVDVRIISATNKDLDAEIRGRRFRKDLFYRLNVVKIELPPLRERAGDISLLADYFLAKYSKDTGKKIKGFTTEALRELEFHSWPGNVRELENVISRGVALTSTEFIEPESLGLSSEDETRILNEPLKAATRDFEMEYIRKVLKQCSGNRRRAAEMMGISLRTLQYKIQDRRLEEEI